MTTMREPPRAGPIATAVRELERRRYAAMSAADVVELAGLLAEQLTYTHSNASRDTKTEYLAMVADGTFDYGPITHTEHDVLVLDDVVLVVGEMRTDAVIHGAPRSIHNAGLSVWVRGGAHGWELAAYQPTPIAR
jgi:hypothetical protein